MGLIESHDSGSHETQQLGMQMLDRQHNLAGWLS